MLKNLKRFAKQQELVIDAIAKSDNLVEILCPMTPESATKLKNCGPRLYTSNPIKNDASSNPNFLTYYQIDLSSLPVSKLEIAAAELALVHTFLESDLDTPLENLWITFLGVYASSLGHLIFILSDPEQGGKKRFFMLPQSGSADGFLEKLNKISGILDLPLNFFAQKTDAGILAQHLRKKYEDTYNFYIRKDSQWLQNFYDALGDNLSKVALFSFLRQRMQGKVFYDTDIIYAMTPTIQSAATRKTAFESRSSWPWLMSASITNLPFMVINTFIIEQYRIPDIVEAEPGDTVLDVGAAFGDTSVYFSQLMRNQGRILAIDPLMDNLEDLRKNLSLHGCTNVEICSYGLAEKAETAWVHSGKTDSNSVAEISDRQDGDATPVKITTIDAIAKNMRVDFIKADIEGSELSMIYGAKETIKRDKPTFALALYHKENDFRDFPQVLSQYNPDYKYFIRMDAEPMFFAVDKNKLENKQ